MAMAEEIILIISSAVLFVEVIAVVILFYCLRRRQRNTLWHELQDRSAEFDHLSPHGPNHLQLYSVQPAPSEPAISKSDPSEPAPSKLAPFKTISIRTTDTTKLLRKGNNAKLQKEWQKAGQQFEAAAEQFSKKRRDEHDAANNYSEAANCYRKLPEKRAEAVRCLQRAAEIYAEQGQFSIAARHLEEAGDLARSQDSKKAIELYQRATDFWSGEDSPASAAGSRTKAAELMADSGMLREAAKLFEDLGVSAESHSLLGFGAKDHLAKCCLCLLCSGAEAVGEKAEQLAGLCGSFKDSDEFSLVTALSAAADARDVGALDAAVVEFERFNNVDDFAKKRLDQLRNFVASGGVQLK